MARVVLQYKYCIAGWKGHEAGWALYHNTPRCILIGGQDMGTRRQGLYCNTLPVL